MTRSNDPHQTDDPFGDLPEWRERRRLQELQSQQAGAAAGQPAYGYEQGVPDRGAAGQGYDPNYAASDYPPQQQRYAGDQTYDYGQAQGHDPYAGQGIGQAVGQGAVQGAGAPVYDYGAAQQGAPSGYPQQPAYGHPLQGQQGGGYGEPTAYADQVDARGQPLHYDLDQSRYQEPARPAGPLPGGQPSWHAPPDPGYLQHGGSSVPAHEPQYAPAEPVLREGSFDTGMPGGAGGAAYLPTGQLGAAGPAGYGDGYATAPGLQGDSLKVSGDDAAWNGAAAGGVAGDGYQGGDDDDYYYDDEEDEVEQRYSWKMLAAVVVTGAVLTGGGFVLYDSLSGGGSGPAPIIRAGDGPAKTEPDDPGGKQFAHRDSKLLGRLDNAGGQSGARNLDPDNPNRVRAVPTVKIGRDGRMILPKPPEDVSSANGDSEAVSRSSETAGSSVKVPGLNVVNSLNGSSDSLPPVLAKTRDDDTASGQSQTRTARVAPEVKPVAPTTSRQPVIKNRTSGANKATSPSRSPPPVPGKSAVGSGWRMTSAQAAAQKRPTVGSIQPTIAQPVDPVRSGQQRSSARQSASTLGAGSVANSGYVAVLATEASRMKALSSFADIQQKYPGVLRNRVPDVRRADLTSRGLGIMYRAVVGPAGTRNSANQVCANLKAQGYKGCWVTKTAN